MARAQGARAQMALAFETVYGTPPASGYRLMPFTRTMLGAEQPLLNSELLGYGRDPLAPIKDAVTADGEVLSGFLLSHDDEKVVLSLPTDKGAKRVLPVDEIDELMLSVRDQLGQEQGGGAGQRDRREGRLLRIKDCVQIVHCTDSARLVSRRHPRNFPS